MAGNAGWQRDLSVSQDKRQSEYDFTTDCLKHKMTELDFRVLWPTRIPARAVLSGVSRR
jgi:hypothetical protein